MKLLVVDDSLTMRRILINILGTLGLTDVDQASNGNEAVVAVTGGGYDLVLMDWNMPMMSGFDALKAIRAAGEQVPVIMVTTEAEKSRIMDALKAGANSYIIKPFTQDAITGKLKAFLTGSERAAG